MSRSFSQLLLLLTLVALNGLATAPVFEGHSLAQASGIDDRGGAGLLALDEGAGPTPRALVVGGEHDAIRVDGHPDLSPSDALTLELWVKRDPALGCTTLVGRGRSSAPWLAICEGRLRFSPAGPATAMDGARVIPEHRWTHVALSHDGARMRFYVDGVLDRELAAAGMAPSNAQFVIGADAELGAPFSGRLDHVRLWNVARSAAQIEANRFQSLGPQSGLVAEWALDGDGRDLVGLHHGEAINGGTYGFDGVLPRSLDLPFSAAIVNMDARCDPAEYGTAERLAIDGFDSPSAYLQTSADDLFVCLEDIPRATSTNAIVSVYVDRDLSGDDRAGAGDYRFNVRPRGNPEVDEGDGQGNYRDLNLAQGEWQAVSQVQDQRWRTEIRIPRRLIDARPDPDDTVSVGLALAFEDSRTAGVGGFWPVGATADRPASWLEATFAEVEGLAPRVIFEGRVERQDADGHVVGLSGSKIQLIGVEDEIPRILDTVRTDGAGRYELEHRGDAPDDYLVRQVDLRGMSSVSGDAGFDGSAAGANLLHYPVDADRPEPKLSYSEGRFVDRVGAPPAMAFDRHYLIVYDRPVSEADLWPIVQAKRDQGFRVEAISTEEIARSTAGQDLAQQIRGWLKARWEAVEPEPVYALLVGRGDKIPFRDVGWLEHDHRTPGQPDYHPAWPTDWYYADLDSEWDSDGDGYYGEFLGCRPGDTYDDPTRDPEMEGDAECPEAGSLTREGPFGALRTAQDDFVAEISVGRLAVNQPGEVRRALQASVAMEALSADDKRSVLVAGAFWHFQGRSYLPGEGVVVSGGSSRANAWIRSSWSGNKPFGRDSADALEAMLNQHLAPFMTRALRLYETTAPGGDASLSPSRQRPDLPLTAANFKDSWPANALVNVAGHGGPEGVSSARWQHDWNLNGVIDNPAASEYCAGARISPSPQVGPPCWEVYEEVFAGTDLPGLSTRNPVVVANAGGTGAVAWAWEGTDSRGSVIGLRRGPAAVAGHLAGRGRVAAWVGALGPMQPGSLDDFQSRFNQDLLGGRAGGMRAGDALWSANRSLAAARPHDLRSYGMSLFGDPALSYWGNPADTQGAWSQAGGSWRNDSASHFSAPASPELAWTSRERGPQTAVVIGRDGYPVSVGGGELVRYAPGGDVAGAAIFSAGNGERYAPAIATDGLYAAAVTRLQSFDRDLGPGPVVQLPPSALVTGSPRVGPDGTVWLATSAGLARVSGGTDLRMVGSDALTGSPAFRPSGALVWTTQDGRVMGLLEDPMGAGEPIEIADLNVRDLLPPAVGPDGTIFVASRAGRLHAFPPETAAWQVDAGGALAAPPAIGPDGTAYVVNQRGWVTAFAGSRGGIVWRSELGATARAGLVLDESHVYVPAGNTLFALDLALGHVAWSHDLGGPLDARSTPVIGPDRMLYVLRADGPLVALRERGWLAAPTDVTVRTAGGVSVHWRDNSDGEAWFQVEVCDLNDDCELAGSSGPNSTSLALTRLDLEPGEAYYARVQAVGRAGEVVLGGDPSSRSRSRELPDDLLAEANLSSDYGRSALVHAVPNDAVAPVGLTSEALGADAIELRWSAGGDARQLLGYAVQRSAPGGGTPGIEVGYVGPDTTHFVDRDLLPDTRYDYRIVARAEGGAAEFATLEARTRARSLAQPSDISSQQTRDSVTLRWRDNADDEDGYVVERRSPGMARHEVVGQLPPGARGFIDRAYITDGFYHYRVRAFSEDSDSSPIEIGVLVTTEAPVATLFFPATSKNR